jgi:DNA polymerase III delta subunit
VGTQSDTKLIILYGKDGFRKQLELNRIKSQFLEPGTEAFGLQEFKNPEILELPSIMNSIGFGKKIVLVKEFKFLDNKAEANELKQILNAIENIPDNNLIVFDQDKINGTIKLIKELKANTQVEFIELTAFNPWDTQKAAKWLSSLNKSLDLASAEYLVEQIGAEDSGKLYSEFKRLETISQGKITKELIEKESESKHDVFKFIKCFAEANLKQANQELEKLIRAKELHLGTLSILDTNVSKYLKLKLALERKLNDNQIAELIEVSPQRLFYQKQEVTKMQIPFLERLQANILDCEYQIKTGKFKVEQAMKLLVNR